MDLRVLALPIWPYGENMPIISSRHRVGNGLVSYKEAGDKFTAVHFEDIEPLALHCKELRKDPNKGFSKKRGFQLIAKIPVIALTEQKGLVNPDRTMNKKVLRKYLNSPAGEMFKTVEGGI